MKYKKGALLFAPILVIFLVFGLIYAWSEITARYNEFKEEIGERQFGLLNTYHLGEKYLFYIDQSAKYSAYQGIYDLAKSGGCYLGDTHGGYRLWTVDSPSLGICFPSTDDSMNGFLNFFSDGLSNYLSSYTPTGAISGIAQTYDIKLEDGGIIGVANTDRYLKIPIIPNKAGDSPGKYTINPSFRVNLENYDFSDYEKLRNRAQEVINKCANPDANRVPLFCVNELASKEFFDFENLELDRCPGETELIKSLDYKWISGVRSSIYGYCVKSDNPKVYAYDENDDSLSLKDITYRFALEFEDISCTENLPELASFNTQCTEFSCDAYFSCADAESLCYCAPGTGNSCQGQCIPFCSVTASSTNAEDEDISTKCTEFSCDSYLNCGSASTCQCPDPTTPELSVACQGECFCRGQGWKDAGGCDGKIDDKIDCEWNERPQEQVYEPLGCSSTEYRCDARPESECPILPEPLPPPACDIGSCAGECVVYDSACEIVYDINCCTLDECGEGEIC